ncbi:MAG TPA: ModE family transcriptional regulator [Acetobacteraceae bacterium]|nr:ModE family transcriptional regulator [Acetobacteraceae bacterium]
MTTSDVAARRYRRAAISANPGCCAFLRGVKRVRHPERLGLHVRVVLGNTVALGPGKADLLQGIAETGSIAASGRRMGMSYKRAWMLVEAMNSMFAGPLVDAAKGGAGGGGAALTPLGDRMLVAYRRLEAAATKAGAAELAAMRRAVPRRRDGEA